MREFCRCRWERKRRRHGRCPTRTAKMMQTMLPLLMMLLPLLMMLLLQIPNENETMAVADSQIVAAKAGECKAHDAKRKPDCKRLRVHKVH